MRILLDSPDCFYPVMSGCASLDLLADMETFSAPETAAVSPQGAPPEPKAAGGPEPAKGRTHSMSHRG